MTECTRKQGINIKTNCYRQQVPMANDECNLYGAVRPARVSEVWLVFPSFFLFFFVVQYFPASGQLEKGKEMVLKLLRCMDRPKKPVVGLTLSEVQQYNLVNANPPTDRALYISASERS